MSPKEELPKELKAVEAAFSSLVPRTDGVNRDRLMFLAGRESVIQGGTGRRSFPHRLAWPLTASVMTAAAAVLLVMLLARPEPEVIRRIVYVEVDGNRGVAENTQRDTTTREAHLQDTTDSPANADPDRRPGPSPARSEPQPELIETQPGPWSRLLARVTRVDVPARRFQSRYSKQFERMLAAGPNVRLDYATGPLGEEKPSTAPVSYHQLLDSLLDVRESRTPPVDSFPMNSSPLTPGANS